MYNWIILLALVTNLTVYSAQYEGNLNYVYFKSESNRHDDRTAPLDFSDVPLNLKSSQTTQPQQGIHPHVIPNQIISETPLVFQKTYQTDDSKFQGHESIPIHKNSWVQVREPTLPKHNLSHLQFSFNIDYKASPHPFAVAESAHPGMFKSFFYGQNIKCMSTAYTVYLIERELLGESLAESSVTFESFSRRLHRLPRVTGTHSSGLWAAASNQNIFLITYHKPCWDGADPACGIRSLMFIKQPNLKISASVGEFVSMASSSYSTATYRFMLNEHRFATVVKSEVERTATVSLVKVRWRGVVSIIRTSLAEYSFKHSKSIHFNAKIESPIVLFNKLQQNAAMLVHLRGLAIITNSMHFLGIRDGICLASYSTISPSHVSLFAEYSSLTLKEGMGSVDISDRLHNISLSAETFIRLTEYRILDEEGRRNFVNTSPMIFSYRPICMKNMEGSEFEDESDPVVIVKRSIPAVHQWCRPLCKIAYSSPSDFDVYRDDLLPLKFKTFSETVYSSGPMKWAAAGGKSFVFTHQTSETRVVPFQLFRGTPGAATERANEIAVSLWRETPKTTTLIEHGHKIRFVAISVLNIRWGTLSAMEHWKELLFKGMARIPVYRNIEAPIVLKNSLKQNIAKVSVHSYGINVNGYVTHVYKLYTNFASHSTIHSNDASSTVNIQHITLAHMDGGKAYLVDSVKMSHLVGSYSGLPNYQLATERKTLRDIQASVAMFTCLPLCVKHIEYPSMSSAESNNYMDELKEFTTKPKSSINKPGHPTDTSKPKEAASDPEKATSNPKDSSIGTKDATKESEVLLVKRFLSSVTRDRHGTDSRQTAGCRPVCSISYVYGTLYDSSCGEGNWLRCGYDKRPPNNYNDWPLHYETSLSSVLFQPLQTKTAVSRWTVMALQSVRTDPLVRWDVPTNTMVILESRKTHLILVSLRMQELGISLQKARPNVYKLDTESYPPKSLKDIHVIPLVAKKLLNQPFAAIKYRYVGYLKGLNLHLRPWKSPETFITFIKYKRHVFTEHTSDVNDSHVIKVFASPLVNDRTFTDIVETSTYGSVETSIAIPHRVCYQNNKCLSKTIALTTGIEKEDSVRECELKELSRKHQCTIFASFTLTPRPELKGQLKVRSILYKLKLISLLRLRSVVDTLYLVDTIVRTTPKTTTLATQGHTIVRMAKLLRYQPTAFLYPTTSTFGPTVNTASGVNIPVKKFVAPSTLSSPRLRAIPTRKHSLLLTGCFYSYHSFEAMRVITSATEEPNYEPVIRTFVPAITDTPKYTMIAVKLHVRSNVMPADYSYVKQGLKQFNEVLKNEVDESVDVGEVIWLVLFKVELHSNDQYMHYRAKRSGTATSLTIQQYDHSQSLIAPSLVRRDPFYCPGPFMGNLRKKSFDVLCIQGIEGPYYWTMPNKNVFVIWGIPSDTIDFQAFNKFPTKIYPEYQQKLMKREIPLIPHLYYFYPTLGSNYYGNPSTVWFYSDNISVQIVTFRRLLITHTYESVTEHFVSYVAFADPILYTLSGLNDGGSPSRDLSYGRHYDLIQMPKPSKVTVMLKRPVLEIHYIMSLKASSTFYYSVMFLSLFSSAPTTEINQLVLLNLKTSSDITARHTIESIGLRIKVHPTLQIEDGFIRPFKTRKKTEKIALPTSKHTSNGRMTYRLLVDKDGRDSYYIVIANIVSVRILPKISYYRISFIKWFIKPFPTTVTEGYPPYLYRFGSTIPHAPYPNVVKASKAHVHKPRVLISWRYVHHPHLDRSRSVSPSLVVITRGDAYLLPVWRNHILKSVVSSFSESTTSYLQAEVLHPVMGVKHEMTTPPKHYMFAVWYSMHKVSFHHIYEMPEIQTHTPVFVTRHRPLRLIAVQKQEIYLFKAPTFHYALMRASKIQLASIAVSKDDAFVTADYTAYIEILLQYDYRTETGHSHSRFHILTRIMSIKSVPRRHQLNKAARRLLYQQVPPRKHYMMLQAGNLQRIMRIVTRHEDVLGIVTTTKTSIIDVLRFGDRDVGVVQVSWTQLRMFSSYEIKHVKRKLGKTTDASIIYSDQSITSPTSRHLFMTDTLRLTSGKYRYIALSTDLFLAVADTTKAEYVTWGFRSGVSASQALLSEFLIRQVLLWMLTTRYESEVKHELLYSAKRQISAGMGRIISDHSWYADREVSIGMGRKDTSFVADATTFIRIIQPIGQHTIITKTHQKIYYSFQLWNSFLDAGSSAAIVDLQLQSYFRIEPRHRFTHLIERTKGVVIYPGYVRKSAAPNSLVHQLGFGKIFPSFMTSTYKSLKLIPVEAINIDGRWIKRYLKSTIRMHLDSTYRTSVQQRVWSSFHASSNIEDGHVLLRSSSTVRVFSDKDVGPVQLIKNRYLIGYTAERVPLPKFIPRPESVAVYSVGLYHERSLHQTLEFRQVTKIKSHYSAGQHKFRRQAVDMKSVFETEKGHFLQKNHHFSSAIRADVDGINYIAKNRGLSFLTRKSVINFKPSRSVLKKSKFIAAPRQLRKLWRVRRVLLTSTFGMMIKSQLSTLKQNREVKIQSSYEVISMHLINLTSNNKAVDISKPNLSKDWSTETRLISSHLTLHPMLKLSPKASVAPVWSEVLTHNVQYIKPRRCEFVVVLEPRHDTSAVLLTPEVLHTIATSITVTDKHQYQSQHAMIHGGATEPYSISRTEVLPHMSLQFERGSSGYKVKRYSFVRARFTTYDEVKSPDGEVAIKFVFGSIKRVSHQKQKFVYTVDQGKTISFRQRSDIEQGVVLFLERSLEVKKSADGDHKSKRWFGGRSIINYSANPVRSSSLIPKILPDKMFRIQRISKVHRKIIDRNQICITVVVKILHNKYKMIKEIVKDINTDISVISGIKIRHIGNSHRIIQTLPGRNNYHKIPSDRAISVSLIILNMTPFAKIFRDADSMIQVKEQIKLQRKFKVRFVSSNIILVSSTAARGKILQEKLTTLRTRSAATNGRVMASFTRTTPLHGVSFGLRESQNEEKTTRNEGRVQQVRVPELRKHRRIQDHPKFVRILEHDAAPVVKYVKSEVKGKLLLSRHRFDKLVVPKLIGSFRTVAEVTLHRARSFRHHHSIRASVTKLVDKRMAKHPKSITVIYPKLTATVDIELFLTANFVSVTAIKTIKLKNSGAYTQQFVENNVLELKLKHIKLKVETFVIPKHVFNKWPFVLIIVSRLADAVEVATLKHRQITGKNIVIHRPELKKTKTRYSKTAYIDGILKNKFRKITKYGFSLAFQEVLINSIVKENKVKKAYIIKMFISTEGGKVLKSFLYITKEKAKTHGMADVNRLNKKKQGVTLSKPRKVSLGTIPTAPIDFLSLSLSTNNFQRDPVRCTSEIAIVNNLVTTTWRHSLLKFAMPIPSSVVSGGSSSSKGPYTTIYRYKRYEMDSSVRAMKDSIFGAKKVSITYISYSSPILVRQSANLDGPNVPGGFKYHQLATQKPSRVKGLKSTLASTYLDFTVIQCRFYRRSILSKDPAFGIVHGFDISSKDITCDSATITNKKKSPSDTSTNADAPSNPIHQTIQLQSMTQIVYITTCEAPLLIQESSANIYESGITNQRIRAVSFSVTPHSLHQMVSPRSNRALTDGHRNSNVIKMTSFTTASSFAIAQEGVVSSGQDDGMIINDPVDYKPHGLLLIGSSASAK